MHDFFRKERAEVFGARFSLPTPPGHYWGLKSNIIFKAKNISGKRFKIRMPPNEWTIECTADIHPLAPCIVVHLLEGHQRKVKFRFNETELSTIISDPNKKATLEYKIIEKLFKDHANSSSSSPLISGCATNNFESSKTYPGHKLHLQLSTRTPVTNPFASGLEKECFLIGQVNDTDCRLIKYLGETRQNINELVNPFGSKIPRPQPA